MYRTNPLRYGLLYIPFIISWILTTQYHTAYIIAWLGSFFIFYLSYSGLIKKLPEDLKISEQLMRPIFLMQVIFAGYMCCSTIFYYINCLGYQYVDFVGRNRFFGEELFISIAKSQQYYVLGHAALVHGILYATNYSTQKKYRVHSISMSNLLLGISVICLPLGYIFSKISGLNQFSIQLSGLSFVAGTIALAFAIREHRKVNLIIATVLFVGNLYASLLSGYKEPIIICFTLLGVFLLPIYGKKIVPIFILILIVLFLILPTYIGNFRGLAKQGYTNNEIRDKSFNALLNANEDDLKEDNWAFLVFRLSEIDMFIKYQSSTPQYIPFYKTSIVVDGITAIIPRFFWPNKPIMENQIMNRVYQAGVINQSSTVSAKPAYIVDSYLSFGGVGVWFFLLLYGYFAQWISNRAELLFGGYFMGSAVMFAGLFQILWRGNCFEFIISSVFWSYITMYIIFHILKARGTIECV